MIYSEVQIGGNHLVPDLSCIADVSELSNPSRQFSNWYDEPSQWAHYTAERLHHVEADQLCWSPSGTPCTEFKVFRNNFLSRNDTLMYTWAVKNVPLGFRLWLGHFLSDCYACASVETRVNTIQFTYLVVWWHHNCTTLHVMQVYFLELPLIIKKCCILKIKFLFKNLWECKRFFCQNTDKNFSITTGKYEDSASLCEICEQRFCWMHSKKQSDADILNCR